MLSKDIVKLVTASMDEKKAENIKVIDISKVSVIADYFIIASGNNKNQIQAMADDIEEKLTKQGVEPKQIEGYANASWILLDYRDVIIHIFNKEDRLFYDIERIWTDGRLVENVDEL